MGSSKKVPAPKKDQLAALHSPSTAIKAAQALQTAKATKSAGSASMAAVSAPNETGFTHHLPTKEQIARNGRKVGRNLILWQRPRMVEKLLHCLLYEMDRQSMRVSWDTIAHRLHPGASGSSIKQYINRSRNGLVAEGHVVAPIFKKNKAYDPTIRGYMRDISGPDGKIVVRAVGYGEYIEDPRVNEPDALEVLAEIKAQLEAEEASEAEGDEEFDFEDDISPATCLTIPDDARITTPPSPTPARHAAPRQSTIATECAANPQSLQLPAGQATLAQEPIAPVPVTQVADVSAANVWADNIQEIQNFDADTIFQLAIGSEFVTTVEANSATQSPAHITQSPVPVTQSPVHVTQSPVTFTQASPDTTSISQAPLELSQFPDIPVDASLFPELDNGFPFVLGSENLYDPFSIPAPIQPYQTQVNHGGQYIQQQVQQQAQQQAQQTFDDSWFMNACFDLQGQLFTPSQTNASLSQYDFSMSSSLSSTLPSTMTTTLAPTMPSTMGPIMTSALANVMTPAMTPSPEHKAGATAADFTIGDDDLAKLLQYNTTH